MDTEDESEDANGSREGKDGHSRVEEQSTAHDKSSSDPDSEDSDRSMYDKGSVGGFGTDGERGVDSDEDDPDSEESGSSDSGGAAVSSGGEETPGFDAPLLGDDRGDSDEPERVSGTFYVKHVEEIAATLHEVDTGQICTLIENPDFERHEIVEASLVAQPPMEVSYLIEDIESRRTIPVEASSESPTRQVQQVGPDIDVGDAVAIEREGEGEIHILRVEDADRTVEELLDDEMTYKNAARYGVERVEIRSDADEGIVSVRYLP